MAKTRKSLSYYRALPYNRRIDIEVENGEEFFVASVTELPGLKADGPDATEALRNLQEAFDDYIEAMIGWGADIPEPELWPGRGYEPPRTRPRGRARKSGPATPEKWEDVESGRLAGASSSKQDLQPV